MEKLKLLKRFQNCCNKTVTTRGIHFLLALFFIASNAFSKGYSQTELKLNFKDVKIENIISFIEKRTDYRFLYQTSDLNLKKKVNINYKGKIADVVKTLFKGTDVYPVIVNKQVVLKRKLNLQQRVVQGRVVDVDGMPMPDVNILVNKFERGTITDANGNYKITAKAGDKILFSFMGFKDQEITVGNSNTINVTLMEDVDMLEEVVLVGYGKEKRENIATAISTIKGNTLETNLQSGSSFDRGLEGLVKGVMVTQGTGELGKGADVIIRGVTSPFREGNRNNPLYVIDGVAISTSGHYNGANPLQSINSADIESIDILKDAAATAIYGSRGANGVIIIKTKQGLYDQPTTVNLTFKTTVGMPVKMLDYLNASEFKSYILQLNKNSWDYFNSLPKGTEQERQVVKDYALMLGRLERYGFYQQDSYSTEVFYDPSRINFGTANTDWNKVVFRDAAVTSLVNASVSGGAEKSAYTVSLGYVNKEGILRADEKKQYNARLSTQFDISEKIRVGISANYSNVNIKSGYSNAAVGNFTTDLGAGTLRFRPDLPVYNKDGTFTYDKIVGTEENEGSTSLYPNPLAITTLGGQGKRDDDMLLTNIFGEYDITKDLMFKAEYTYGVFFSNGRSFRPQQYNESGRIIIQKEEEDPISEFAVSEGQEQVGLTLLTMDEGKTINSSINYTLNYAKNFGKNSIKGLLGFSHTHDKAITDGSTYTDFSIEIPLPQYAKIKSKRDRIVFNSGLNSYFGRISYGYDDRYTLTAVARLDRSSKFAPENRNAFFPSISASWNIHNESFLSNSFFNKLRLRTSAGRTGSVTVGDFAYLQRFNSTATNTYKGNPSFAFARDFANRRLQWEKTTEYNVGIDVEMKKGRLRGSLDLYHKTTTDVVSKETEVVETGATNFDRNNATILNKGFEVSLGADIIKTGNFRWSIDANASKNINKLLAVSEEIAKDREGFTQFYTVGREVNLIKGYVVNGIIQTPERLKELNDLAKAKNHQYYDTSTTTVGDYEYKDTNGDGRITIEDGLQIIGSRQPDLFGGFNTQFRYNRISLGANFSYAYGLESSRFNQAQNYGRFLNIERYMSPQYRWSPTNKKATLSRLLHKGGDDENPADRRSSINVFDASYLRLSSLKLGYDLPEQTISNLGFSRVNMYVIGTNLATWTSFPGLDPTGASEGAASEGSAQNNDAYPSAKTFSIGVNLQF